MKKLVVALTALVGFAAPALAADMAPRTYAKVAPPVQAVASWTGFWISGGFGYEMMQYQHSETSSVAPFALYSPGQDIGGKGWLGKVGIGYDYQFMGNFVIGAFADAQWSNVSGQGAFACPPGCPGAFAFSGRMKNDWSWGAGGRVGYVALPGLLTYFNAGYTQAHFQQTNYTDGFPGSAFFGSNTGLVLPSRTKSGYFLGGGTEYAVNWVPGLFWKNEVRFSNFGDKTDAQVCTAVAGGNCGVVGTVQSLQRNHVYEQAATTELVYRFNWGGPVVAKY